MPDSWDAVDRLLHRHPRSKMNSSPLSGHNPAKSCRKQRRLKAEDYRDFVWRAENSAADFPVEVPRISLVARERLDQHWRQPRADTWHSKQSIRELSGIIQQNEADYRKDTCTTSFTLTVTGYSKLGCTPILSNANNSIYNEISPFTFLIRRHGSSAVISPSRVVTARWTWTLW